MTNAPLMDYVAFEASVRCSDIFYSFVYYAFAITMQHCILQIAHRIHGYKRQVKLYAVKKMKTVS